MKTIRINFCNNCHYINHSGAFTPGGVKIICGNSYACCVRATTHKDDKYHWIHRVLLKKNKQGKYIIPEWCPLPLR